MPQDPAVQLERLHAAGFAFETFERYPRAVGVLRDGLIALLTPTPDGLARLGPTGWRMGEVMGVLVERDGRQVFQANSETAPATEERIEARRRFDHDLDAVLRPPV